MEFAEQLATKLLQKKLVACCQIHKIRSHYSWKGNIENDDEWILNGKTIRKLYPKIEDVILEIHPYDVPEIISMAIVDVSDAYAEWLISNINFK